MKVTGVEIVLPDAGPHSELRAYATVCFDEKLVVHDVKVIVSEDERGVREWVAFPSRRATDHCPRCRCTTDVRARYCWQCGERLADDRPTCFEPNPKTGKPRFHLDIAHPIDRGLRQHVKETVLAAYHAALERRRVAVEVTGAGFASYTTRTPAPVLTSGAVP